jgi:ATP-dependent RNA helicase RhlE
MTARRNDAGHAGQNPNTQNAARAGERSSAPADAAGTESSSPGGVFSELIPELRRALADTGYSVPTPVQSQCIPPLAAGRDLLGSAQTGTGKTAAFTLPLLQYVARNPRPPLRRTPRVLILAPTRELAAQIGESIRVYSSHLKISHTVVFGGVGQGPQERAMNRGVDFLVATPGRLLDLMGQGIINLREVEAFVLDEADRMLDMGFIRDIRKVIEQLPAKRQTLFFSATLSQEIVSLSKSMLRDPVRVTIAPEQPTVERIAQKVMFVDKGHKDALLVSLLSDSKVDKVIVFVQMKHVANKVADRLTKSGITAVAIHGNKSQGARTNALKGFKAGRVRVLVATDIAARGIDVDGITHVINYHLPIEAETYVHRIGRTARAGADGDAVSFCSASERDQLRDIERVIRKSIPVDDSHAHHSESAANAVGAEARPEPRGGQRGGGNQRGGRSGAPADAARRGGGGKRGFRPKRTRGPAMRRGSR